MTIASEIARLQGVKTDILGAIAEKKVDVPSGAMLADAPDLIRSIKSGINVKIGQGVYPAVKIGNQLWLAKNLDENLGTIGVDEWCYNGRNKPGTQINNVSTISTSAWSPTSSDSTTFYNWEDGKSTGTSATGFAIPCIDRQITISFDYEYASDVSETRNFVVYVNGFRNDGTYSQGSWCGDSPSYSTKSGSMKFTVTLSAEIELLQTMRFSSLISGNRITIRNLRIVWGGTMATNLVTIPQALENEETSKANNYGRLYTWNNINENLSKLNLNGWRWPNREDYDKLVVLDTTGKKLRIPGFFSGTDDYGFSAVPSGILIEQGVFSGNAFNSWSNVIAGTIDAIRFNISKTSAITENTPRTRGLSLRLVLDLNDDGTIPGSNIVIEEPATTAEPLALASEHIVTEETE